MDPDQKPIIDLGGIARNSYRELVDTFPILKRLIPVFGTRNGRIGLAGVWLVLMAAVVWARMQADRNVGLSIEIQRVSHLQQLNLNIIQYYQDHRELPAKLSDLEIMANPTYVRDWYMFDPETRLPFRYDKVDQHSYQICANLQYSTKDVAQKMPVDVANPVWDHDPGPHCFRFDAPELKEDDKTLVP